MNKYSIGIIGIIVLLAVTYGVYRMQNKNELSEEMVVGEKERSSYTVSDYGLKFSFPQTYFLAGEKEGQQGEYAYLILLAQSTPEAREIFSNPDVGIQGPASILITIFDNTTEGYTSKRFFEAKSVPYHFPADTDIENVTIGDEEGIRFVIDEYKTAYVIVARPEYVYLFTAFYDKPTDVVFQDFEEILTSVEFFSPETTLDLPPAPEEILPYTSGVQGRVILGPTCPVMREGDDSCADKPYQTTVQIIEIGSPQSAPFATAESDSDGYFSVELPRGKYALQAVGGAPLPSCDTQEVTVEEGVLLDVSLSCDSGIR